MPILPIAHTHTSISYYSDKTLTSIDYAPIPADSDRILLVRQSHRVFVQAQVLRQQSNGMGLSARGLLSVSQKYRRALLDYIHASAETSDDKEVLWQAQIAWHLLELIFFSQQQHQNTPLVSQLLDWLDAAHDKSALFQRQVQAVMDRPLPYSLTGDAISGEFWRLMLELILRGRYEESHRLLSHSLDSSTSANASFESGGTDILLALSRLLQRFPGPKKAKTMASESEYATKFHQWRTQVSDFQSRYSQSLSTSAGGILADLVKIMLGDEQVIKQYATTWEEALIAYLLHHHPLAKHAQIPPLLSRFAPDENMSETAALITAVLEMDAYKMIQHAAGMDLWFVTHFTDFLDSCGFLDPDELAGDKVGELDFRKEMVLRYGSTLMCSQLQLPPTSKKEGSENAPRFLWELGADYLSYITGGISYLRTFIHHIDISTEFSLQAALATCTKFQLGQDRAQIQKTASRMYLNKGEYGCGLKYALMSGDGEWITQVVDGKIVPGVLGGKFDLEKILQELDLGVEGGGAELESEHPRVIFLAQLVQLDQFIASRQLQQGKQVVMALLTTTITPRHFYPLVLTKCLPFVNEGLLSEDEVCEILRVLEEVEIMFDKDEVLKGCGINVDNSGKVEVYMELRRGCARNLALAALSHR